MLFLSVGLVLCRSEMAGGSGRYDAALVEALTVMVQMLVQAHGYGPHDHGEAEE